MQPQVIGSTSSPCPLPGGLIAWLAPWPPVPILRFGPAVASSQHKRALLLSTRSRCPAFWELSARAGPRPNGLFFYCQSQHGNPAVRSRRRPGTCLANDCFYCVVGPVCPSAVLVGVHRGLWPCLAGIPLSLPCVPCSAEIQVVLAPPLHLGHPSTRGQRLTISHDDVRDVLEDGGCASFTSFYPRGLSAGAHRGSIKCIWGSKNSLNLHFSQVFRCGKKTEELAMPFKTSLFLAAKALIPRKSSISPKINKRKAARPSKVARFSNS